MRRVVVTVAVVTFSVTGGALWLCRSYYLAADPNGSRLAPGIAEPATPKEPTSPRLRHDVQERSEVSDRDDPAKIRSAIEAHNVPLNFLGKIIDQDGVALPEVRILYSYSIYHGNDQGVAWIDFEAKKGETASDGDGLFAITDLKGHDLTIDSVTKPGYLHRERWQLSYNFYGEMPEFRFEPQRGKPVRITMIRTTATESLVNTRGEFDVSGDGSPGHWNLWSGEADQTGELTITYKADMAVPANPAQLFNWSADLEVVGGGISEAPWEEEVHRAPESGYLATVVYPKVNQKAGVPHRSFYLRTADGKYGRIEVELSTSHDGRTARCYIICDMNPRTGSRNLEPSEGE